MSEWLRVPVLFWMCAAAASWAGPSPAYVQAEPGGHAWRIGNNLVERRVAFDPKQGLATRNWIHKVTGRDFLELPGGGRREGQEFRFRTGDRAVSARSDMDFVSATVSDIAPAGKLLRIALRSRRVPLEVAAYYAVYAGHPVVRKWIDITNRSEQPVTLAQLCFEFLRMAPGSPSEVQAFAGYGADFRELFSTGRVSDTALVLKNARTGEGLVVMNEAPGYTKRTEVGENWGDGLRVMYDTDLFPFERSVAPGETFTSAKSSIAFFLDGQPGADARWVVPSYTSEVMLRSADSYLPPWIYNTWEPFERSLNEATTKDLIRAAGRMGMDIFTIDDGWQARLGDNAIRTSHFPDGLGGIRELVAEQHMSLGLWVPLAAIGTDAPDYVAHPEWVCRDSRGRPKFTSAVAGTQGVMCLATQYREAAARRINALIAEYRLRYLKFDLTTVFNTYGEEPGCHAAGHDHKTAAESLGRIYEGMQYVATRIRQEHPEVLLDYTFELWGEKHLIDHGLLGAADLDWLSNVNDKKPGDAGPLQVRSLLYRRALAIPTEAMLIGNLHADMGPIEERFATVIGSGPLLLGDLRKLTAGQLDWYSQKIGWFKKLRAEVKLNEGFFPLGSWAAPSVNGWDGYARLSRQGEGIIVLFRNDSPAREARPKIPAMPEGLYRLHTVVGSAPDATVTRAQIAGGWRIPLDSKVQVIEIRRQRK